MVEVYRFETCWDFTKFPDEKDPERNDLESLAYWHMVPREIPKFGKKGLLQLPEGGRVKVTKRGIDQTCVRME